MRKNSIVGSFCALICEILYGLSYIFTKQATESAGTFALLGWRFFTAAVFMTILTGCGVVKIHLRKKNLKPLFRVALFSPCIYFIAETLGIDYTTASESGIFLACIPVISLGASTVALKKKPAKIQIIGILITFVGVILTVIAAGTSVSLSVTGYIFLAIAVFAYAFYSVSVEKASEFSGVEITYFMLLSGAVVFTIFALIEAVVKGNLTTLFSLPFTDHGFLTAILYQGIGCSIVAFFLSNVAITKIGVNRTSSFIGVATVVSMAAGAIFLHETLTIFQIAGAAIMLAGVYTANSRRAQGSN